MTDLSDEARMYPDSHGEAWERKRQVETQKAMSRRIAELEDETRQLRALLHSITVLARSGLPHLYETLS